MKWIFLLLLIPLFSFLRFRRKHERWVQHISQDILNQISGGLSVDDAMKEKLVNIRMERGLMISDSTIDNIVSKMLGYQNLMNEENLAIIFGDFIHAFLIAIESPSDGSINHALENMNISGNPQEGFSLNPSLKEYLHK